MKKAAVVFAAVMVTLLTVPPASADYIQNGEEVIVQAGAPRQGTGGPFKLVADTDNNRWVHAFCIEKQEFITLNGKYYATTMDEGAIYGGPANNPGGLTYDPITKGTAQLMLDWVSGSSIAGDPYANTAAQNNAIQEAIWILEGEQSTSTPLAESIYNFYAGNIQGGVDDGLENYTGTAVRVINLWTSAGDAYTWGGRAQSMVVVMVPEPASVAVWGLLATALGGGLYMRRRRSK